MTQFRLINLGGLTAKSLAFLPQPHQTNKQKILHQQRHKCYLPAGTRGVTCIHLQGCFAPQPSLTITFANAVASMRDLLQFTAPFSGTTGESDLRS